MVDFVQISKSDLWAIKPGPNTISNDFHHELGAFGNADTVPKGYEVKVARAVEGEHGDKKALPSPLMEGLLWPYYGVENNNFQYATVIFILGNVLIPGSFPTLAPSTVMFSAYSASALAYSVQTEVERKKNPGKQPNVITKDELYSALAATPAQQPETRERLMDQISSLQRV